MNVRVLRAVGHGHTVDQEAMARRCVWCTPPHFLTPADEALYRAGALITDGMCAVGKRAFLASDRIAAEEREAECPR